MDRMCNQGIVIRAVTDAYVRVSVYLPDRHGFGMASRPVRVELPIPVAFTPSPGDEPVPFRMANGENPRG